MVRVCCCLRVRVAFGSTRRGPLAAVSVIALLQPPPLPPAAVFVLVALYANAAAARAQCLPFPQPPVCALLRISCALWLVRNSRATKDC